VFALIEKKQQRALAGAAISSLQKMAKDSDSKNTIIVLVQNPF